MKYLCLCELEASLIFIGVPGQPGLHKETTTIIIITIIMMTIIIITTKISVIEHIDSLDIVFYLHQEKIVQPWITG